ncbi:MAG: SDR family NAD(P)-dependent oxidoreductase [Deltaproteobacteria bacterium]|nr:SDR family NAD(P)-dependent oxidoreductase [Deltaproteobacteria bacterium]
MPQMKSVLVTGANAGLGKESARQLALLESTERVYLGCRNIEKAEAAKAELEELTGRSVFEILQIDVMDMDSVRAAVRALPSPIDGLVMNAGGMGGPTPRTRTREGSTQLFAANVLGHALLVDELIAAGKLEKVAVYSGSEAMRGVRQVRIKRLTFETSSSDEFASIIDGSWLGGAYTAMAAYAASKYVAALWIASMARRHPSIRFVTMSPGGTSGTAAADGMQGFQRILVKYIGKPLMVALRMMHNVETGAARYVNALTDERYESGVFYGNAADAMIGDVVDQATIYADLANEDFQDNAYEAIHRFLPSR